jgi:hypothetical protein
MKLEKELLNVYKEKENVDEADIQLDFKWQKTNKVVKMRGDISLDEIYIFITNPNTEKRYEVDVFNEWPNRRKYIEPDREHPFGHYEGEIVNTWFVLTEIKPQIVNSVDIGDAIEIGVLTEGDLNELKIQAKIWKELTKNEFIFCSAEIGGEMNIQEGQFYELPILKLS